MRLNPDALADGVTLPVLVLLESEAVEALDIDLPGSEDERRGERGSGVGHVDVSASISALTLSSSVSGVVAI